MGKYTVRTGQNIYDVTMHLYGALEGLLDLFINNPSLSFSDKLEEGIVLEYTEGFVINEEIISYNKTHNIIPANGEQHIFFKESNNVFLEIYLPNNRSSASFSFSGEGLLAIDWGDNTDIETVELKKHSKKIQHFFNNQISDMRKIRLSGGVKFQTLDLSQLTPLEIYLLKPLYTEKITIQNSELNIAFVNLLSNCHQADFTGLTTHSLSPLLKLNGLMNLNLLSSHIKPSIIDEYLIGLVKHYGQRRNCHIRLSTSPTGMYREPIRDINGHYTLTSGMEAIWIILHEPAWNEAGHWQFSINENTYTYEQNY